MATRGRKPKPSALKLVTNTTRPSRVNKAEPKPKVVRPVPPAHLCEPALVEWHRLVDELMALGVITLLDQSSFAAYCQAYGRWVLAEEALARFAAKDKATSGIMMKTQAGNAIQNPLVGAANKAMDQFTRLAAEFGMTPAGRARVQGTKESDPDDPETRFFS